MVCTLCLRGSIVANPIIYGLVASPSQFEISNEGRTGYSRYTDKLLLFSAKREFRKLFFVTRDLKILRNREEPELTDIRYFTILSFVILRRRSSDWFYAG